jgi:hypothetical protein
MSLRGFLISFSLNLALLEPLREISQQATVEGESKFHQ